MYIYIYIYVSIYLYSFYPTVALPSSSTLAHFCADTDRALQAPFHPENFNYNRNYTPKKVLPECPRTNNPATRSVADHPSNDDKWKRNGYDDDDDGW